MKTKERTVDAAQIEKQIISNKKSKIKNWPCKSNRASQCGHPCERYLVLSRTRWQDKLSHDVNLEFIFEGGRMIEDMAMAEIRDAGIQVIEQQSAFEWPEIQLTGHLDAKIVVDGKAIPLECKGYQHFQFEKLNSVEDFLKSDRHYIRMAPAQLMMYMMASESEIGLFYLKDKLTFRPKIIPVELDYDYCEQIIKKLERVNKHIEQGTLPEPVNDADLCQQCGFLPVCLPSIKAQPMEFIDNVELEEKLKKREELAPAYKEYSSLDREIKKVVAGKEKLMIGDFLITGKEVERKGYTVEPSSYWKTKIARLG